MNIEGKVVVVTGAGSGIGAELVRAFVGAGAAEVVAVDRRLDAVREVAEDAGATPEQVDVTDAAAVQALVDGIVARAGHIDLFCSNAGILTGIGVEDADPDDLWHRAFEVNTMAHVYAARAVLPSMLKRGEGYLLQTASAAGLLTSPGDAAYAVSKHGAVALAEWLAVTYGNRGIKVSVICPFGVATPMLLDPLNAGEPGAKAVAASGAVLTPAEVASAVLTGLDQERFLIVPHPEVATFWAQKASDPDRWLSGVRRLTERTAD